MSACPRYEPLLLDEVAGALAPPDAVRLEAHRRACAGCRAEAAALAETLALVRLPPVEETERRALAGLAGAAAPALRRRWVARHALGLGAALGAAAAAALLLVAPLARPGAAGTTRPPAAAASPGWQAPDPDALWRAADLFEDDDASTTPSAAALAALED